MSTPVLSARGKLAHAHRASDPSLIVNARRDLAAAKLEQYIERVVAEAPPLTDAQRHRLTALLRGVGGDAPPGSPSPLASGAAKRPKPPKTSGTTNAETAFAPEGVAPRAKRGDAE